MAPAEFVPNNTTLLWASPWVNGAIAVDIQGLEGSNPENPEALGVYTQFTGAGRPIVEAPGAWVAMRVIYVTPTKLTYTHMWDNTDNRPVAFSFDEGRFGATMWTSQNAASYQSDDREVSAERVILVVAWNAPANTTFELAVGWGSAGPPDHQTDLIQDNLKGRAHANLIPGSCTTYAAVSYYHQDTGTSYNRLPPAAYNATVSYTPSVPGGNAAFDVNASLSVPRAGKGWGETRFLIGHTIRLANLRYTLCAEDCRTYSRDPPLFSKEDTGYYLNTSNQHHEVSLHATAGNVVNYDTVNTAGPGRTQGWIIATDLDITKSSGKPYVPICRFPARSLEDVPRAVADLREDQSTDVLDGYCPT